MKKYEVLYIINPTLADDAREALIERFKVVVESNKGSIESVDKWGIKKLAYAINFKEEGYYVLMNFNCEPSLPTEIKRQMNITDDIMRFIIVAKN